MATSKRRLLKANMITNEVVDKLRRVRIANRQYQRVFKRVIERKFIGRAISSDKKVEKEIEIQWEAVQWGAEVARASRGIPFPIAAGAYAKLK